MLIINLKLIVFLFILSNFGYIYSQDNTPIILSPSYDLEDNIKILSDSILIDGYLVFEFNNSYKSIGFDKDKEFFKFIVYFIMDLEDILSENSVKFYYNSNKTLYEFYAFSENSSTDSIKYRDKKNFKKIHEIYLRKHKSKEKPFRIEDFNFDNFSNNNIDFYQSDTLNKRGFFIFECRLLSFLFVAQTNNIFLNKTYKEEVISLLFFEPLSNTYIFKPIDESAAKLKNLSKSEWIWNYMKK